MRSLCLAVVAVMLSSGQTQAFLSHQRSSPLLQQTQQNPSSVILDARRGPFSASKNETALPAFLQDAMSKATGSGSSSGGSGSSSGGSGSSSGGSGPAPAIPEATKSAPWSPPKASTGSTAPWSPPKASSTPLGSPPFETDFSKDDNKSDKAINNNVNTPPFTATAARMKPNPFGKATGMPTQDLAPNSADWTKTASASTSVMGARPQASRGSSNNNNDANSNNDANNSNNAARVPFQSVQPRRSNAPDNLNWADARGADNAVNRPRPISATNTEGAAPIRREPAGSMAPDNAVWANAGSAERSVLRTPPISTNQQGNPFRREPTGGTAPDSAGSAARPVTRQTPPLPTNQQGVPFRREPTGGSTPDNAAWANPGSAETAVMRATPSYNPGAPRRFRSPSAPATPDSVSEQGGSLFDATRSNAMNPRTENAERAVADRQPFTRAKAPLAPLPADNSLWADPGSAETALNRFRPVSSEKGGSVPYRNRSPPGGSSPDNAVWSDPGSAERSVMGPRPIQANPKSTGRASFQPPKDLVADNAAWADPGSAERSVMGPKAVSVTSNAARQAAIPRMPSEMGGANAQLANQNPNAPENSVIRQRPIAPGLRTPSPLPRVPSAEGGSLADNALWADPGSAESSVMGPKPISPPPTREAAVRRLPSKSGGTVPDNAMWADPGWAENSAQQEGAVPYIPPKPVVADNNRPTIRHAPPQAPLADNASSTVRHAPPQAPVADNTRTTVRHEPPKAPVPDNTRATVRHKPSKSGGSVPDNALWADPGTAENSVMGPKPTAPRRDAPVRQSPRQSSPLQPPSGSVADNYARSNVGSVEKPVIRPNSGLVENPVGGPRRVDRGKQQPTERYQELGLDADEFWKAAGLENPFIKGEGFQPPESDAKKKKNNKKNKRRGKNR